MKVGQIKLDIYQALLYRLLIVMLLFTVCRIAFYLYNVAFFPGISFGDFLWMLVGGLKFDIVAVLYLNILYIVLQTIPFQFRFLKGYQTFCKWLFYGTGTFGLFANLFDMGYYRFTLKRTTFDVFSQFSGEQNMVKVWIDFLKGYWYLIIIMALLCYLMAWLYNRVRIDSRRLHGWKRIAWHSVCFVLVMGLFVIGVRGGWRHSTRPITLSNAGEYVNRPHEMSIVLNTPFTLFKTLKAHKLKPVTTYPETELKNLYDPIHLPQGKGPFKKLNVVILIIESLGKEHIGALNRDLMGGKYKGYTPFLDSLIGESATFDRTYANGRKSIDALPSIISGIPSIREPFVLGPYSGNKTTSIAQLLGDEGYETAFFHGAPNGSMGFNSYTKLAGIKHYYGKNEYNNNDDFDGIWGIWDEPFLQFTAKTINTFKQPFFAAMFSVSSHHPFKVPKQYAGKFPKGPLPVQEPVGYTDMALRKFFDTAKKMPWYNNTLFVICADHATVSYLKEYQTISGYFSVPILFYHPGGNLKKVSSKLVQQIDIMPTVLNYMNYPKPYFAFGFDAFAETPNFVINNNEGTFNFYQGDYLLQYDGEKTTGLYDLHTDRLMQHNLAGKARDQQTGMEQKLKAFIQQHDNRMIRDQLTLPANN